ncbi:LYR motif-containing protein 5B [Bulinus truncatus]|nr:LYR motif-containing protein 5B [Bulinus truncatus]
MSNQVLRLKVKQLYKTLLHLGKDYPRGSDYFRKKLHAVFMKNKDVKDPKEIELLIAKGECIVKELESLYMLRKYRTLKKRYYDNEH